MSLKQAANALAAQGRYGDSTLVHMQPREVAGLQALAQRYGRTMTRNPETGLPEAFDLGGLIEDLAPVALGFALGPAGLGMSAMGASLATGAVTGLVTGDLGKGIAAGLGAYGGAEIGGAVSSLGAEAASAAARDTAMQQGVDSSIANTLGSQAAEEATKTQLIKEGAKAALADPSKAITALGGGMGAAKTAYMAASPFLASGATTTQMPTVESKPVEIWQEPLTRKELPVRNNPYDTSEQLYFQDTYGPSEKLGTFKARGGIVALADGGQPAASPGYVTQKTHITPEEFINQYLSPVKTSTTMPGETAPTETFSAPPAAMINPFDPEGWKLDSNGKRYKSVWDETKNEWSMVYENPTDDPNYVDPATLADAQKQQPAQQIDGGDGIANTDAPQTQAPAPVTTIDPTTGAVVGLDLGVGPNGVGTLGAPSVSSDDSTGPEGEPGGISDNEGGVANGIDGDAGGGDGGGASADGNSAAGADGAAVGAGGEKEGGLIKLAKGGLAKDSFVVPADVISAMGNGSTKAGLAALNQRLGKYAAGGATLIQGPGNGLSDSIPTHIEGKQRARVADGEAYIAPQQVKSLGGGNIDKGASKLYAMMDRVRQQAHGKKTQQRPVNPQRALA